MQQTEVEATKDKDGEKQKIKKNIFSKLSKIEVPEDVKILIFALLKQVCNSVNFQLRLVCIDFQVFVFGLVYFVVYLDFSIVWVAGIAILLALRDAKRLQNAKKHELKRAAAMIDEKDALKYRIEDLPSWVLFPDVDRAEWLNKVSDDNSHCNIYDLFHL